MRLRHLLLVAATAWHASAADSDVGLDLVFPGNKTQKTMSEMPVIFAIHNADKAFLLGYQISWKIEKASTSPNTTTGGMPYGNIIQKSGQKAPLNAVNNIWYATDTVDKLDDLEAGDYSLRWEWFMMTCSSSGSLTSYHPSDSVAEGSINFTLADDGPAFSLTQDCPAFLHQLTVTSVSSGNCAHVAETDDKHDTCKAKLSMDMSTCVMANLTKTDDQGSCAKLIRVTDDEDANDEADDNGDKNDTASDDGSNKDDNDSLSSTISTFNFCTLGLLTLLGGALLY